MKTALLSLAVVWLSVAWLVEARIGNGVPSVGLTDVCQIRYKLMELDLDMWEKVEDPRWMEVTDGKGIGPDVELAKVFVAFSDRVEAVLPLHKTDILLNGYESWLWKKILAECQTINQNFEIFQRFLHKQIPNGRVPGPIAGPHAWENMATNILRGNSSSVPDILDRLATLVQHSNFYTHTLQESSEQLCSLQQSPHQLIYNMYNSITLTEIKGYTMMQFSWMLLRLYGKGNFTIESNLMRHRFQERSMMALASVRSALEDASREIWRCDPSYHEEGQTFVALTRLLQGYIENEVDMNKDGTCKENCGYYTYAKNHGCFKDQFCSKQPQCTGKIHDCRYIDSDMWICQANPSSSRRYSWIEYENKRVLGQKDRCTRGESKVDSWWRLDLYHCSYCMCLCDEPSNLSHRHFSMKSVVSNLTENKVVTGVRFTKVNKVIHLQISEGTLLPRGKIDAASVRWKPVTELNIKDISMVRGVDYHTMSYEERSMDLDDLFADEGHLLTGVRFRKIGSHLNFEIQITPFNFTTGKLTDPLEKSLWISNDNTDAAHSQPRTQVHLQQPDIPTRSRTPSIIDSKSDQFIQFTNSDFDADVAQTTVPFLDAQPVTSLYPVPLSGAGIYHKGRAFYGGFVAPKVFTYDYSQHMVPVFPVIEDVVN